MVEKLRSFNADRMDLDDLIALHAFAKDMKASYAEFGVDEPDWFTGSLKSLAREIKVRNAANLERQLSEKRSRMEALQTPAERREKLQIEIEALNSKLAGV